MGNNVSCTLPSLTEFIQASQGSQSIEANDYKIVHEINDPRFGIIQLMKSRSRNHQLYVKERELDYDESQLDEIKFRAQLSNPYLIEIYGFKRANAENRIQIYFETFESDLERGIQKAITEKTVLPEEKLNNLLHCILNALAYLQENNVVHENITPLNIVRIGSTYKVHENSIIMTSASLYEQALKGHNLRYLAPELLANISKRDQIPRESSFKSDVYSLGICLLDAGVLDFGETTIVDRKTLDTIQENLFARIKRFKELYSPQLSSIVEEMITLDPKKRPDAVSLYKRLPSKIVDERKRIFTPMKEPPKKIDYTSIIQSKSSGSSKPAEQNFREENRTRSEKNLFDKISYTEPHIQNPKPTVKSETALEDKVSHSEVLSHPVERTIDVTNSEKKPPQDPRLNSHERRTAFSEQITTKINQEYKIDDTSLGALKISEAILHDPILSKIVKNMYDRHKIGTHNINQVHSAQKKHIPTQIVKKSETPNRSFTFLSPSIDSLLEKKETQGYSPQSFQPLKFTASKYISPPAKHSENKQTESRDTQLNYRKNESQRTSYAQSVLQRSRNQSSTSVGIGHSSDRYSKPTDLHPYQQPYNYFRDSAQKQYSSYPSKNLENTNFTPQNNADPSFTKQSATKRDLETNFNLLRNSPSRRVDDEEDIAQRINLAILKSKENIVKAKNLSSQKSSPHIYQKNFAIQNNPFNSFSAERADKPSNYNAVTPFNNGTANLTTYQLPVNEYEKLSNEELAKLVAEIKKEFKPKQEELQKSQAPSTTPSKNKPQVLSGTTKKERYSFGSNGLASASPAKNQDSYAKFIKSPNQEPSGDPNSFDAKINELKRDLQNYFTQAVPADNT